MTSIDEYSTTTCPIEMFFGDTNLSLGTAFSWQVGDQHYLITNWHNLTGINPINGQRISKYGAEPNRIKIWYHANTKRGDRYREFVNLLDEDGRPLWLVHPQHGNKIDVVALPVPQHPDVTHYPINKMSQEKPKHLRRYRSLYPRLSIRHRSAGLANLEKRQHRV